MKNMKKIFASFISFALAFSMIAAPLLHASAYEEEKAPAAEAADTSKISPELAEIMAAADEDDLIPVYIFRYLMQEEEVQELIYEETGMDPAIYEDQDLFEAQIVPGIAEKAEAQYGYEAAHAVNPDTMSSYIDDEIAVEIDSFLEAKRSILKREYTLDNAEFAEKHIADAREILFESSYTSTIIVEATKAEILAYAELADVEKMMYFENLLNTSALDITSVQAGTGGTNGTKSTIYNGGIGYKGRGVVIGVIEAEGGMYDPNSLMLSGIPATQLSYVSNVRSDGTIVPSYITSHATKVTEIIVGKAVTVSGRTYEGFAPEATVYQTTATSIVDLYTAFQILAGKGAHILNFSAGVSTTGYYAYDLEIDRLITTTNVSFVAAAGNSAAEVSSPAKALNAVAVGSAETKSSAFVGLSEPYTMASYSSYTEADYYMPNKPEISAPGSLISTPATTTSVTSGSGTSFAAPMIAAIMAQSMQRSATFKTNPYAAKAFIVLCAEYSQISTTSNPTKGSYYYDKSGSGLIQAKNLMKEFAGMSGTIATTGSANGYSATYNFTAGQRVRIVLAFGKKNNLSITSSSNLDDIDLRLLNSAGNSVGSSISAYNNIETIEYTVPTTGEYTIQVYGYRLADIASGAVPFAVYWMVK